MKRIDATPAFTLKPEIITVEQQMLVELRAIRAALEKQ